MAGLNPISNLPLDALNSVRKLGGVINMAFNPHAMPAEEIAFREQHHARPHSLHDIKAGIIEQLRQNAIEESLQTGEERRPTIEDYRKAAEAFGRSEEGQKILDAHGHHWDERIAADLSGQNLSGFLISEPKKMQPYSNFLKKEEQQGNKIESAVDLHDRDGDGKINIAATSPFYDNIRFDKADLHGAWVEPATSFNDQISKAGNLTDITFSGMKHGDHFEFTGSAENIHMFNINDGSINFAGGHATAIHIEGKSASISVGMPMEKDIADGKPHYLHAHVSNISFGDGFRVLELNVGKHGVLSGDLSQLVTLSPSSHFEPGAELRDVKLNCNLSDIDLSGVKLNNVEIFNRETKKYEAITDTKQLDDLGIAHDKNTQISHRHAAKNELEEAAYKLRAAQDTIGNPLNEYEIANLDRIQAENAARAARQQEQVAIRMPGSHA